MTITPGSGLARLVCAVVGHRWARRPHLVAHGEVVVGECTRCLLYRWGSIERRPSGMRP